MKAWLVVGILAAFVTQCGYYNQTPSDRKDPETEQKKQDEKDFKNAQNCNFGVKTGCVTGAIVTNKVFLNDQEMFDASALVRQAVAQLAVVDDQGTQLVAGHDFEAALVSPLTEDTFLDGFTVSVKGDEARPSVSVSSKGVFKIDYLDIGTYDFHMQKKIDVKVADKRIDVKPEPTPADTANPTPANPVPAAKPIKAAEIKSKNLCLVIVSDQKGVTVTRGKGLRLVIDHYQTQLMDQSCTQVSSNPVVVL